MSGVDWIEALRVFVAIVGSFVVLRLFMVHTAAYFTAKRIDGLWRGYAEALVAAALIAVAVTA